jgi:putative transposase
MGRKRHIISDTLGLMLFVTVHAASIQDRDGAVNLIQAVRYRFPWLRHIFADGGYAGEKLANALRRHGQWTLEIVRGCDAAKGFVLLPRRWVVERTFAWLGRCRRLAKDREKSIESPPSGPPSPASVASSQAIVKSNELSSQPLRA